MGAIGLLVFAGCTTSADDASLDQSAASITITSNATYTLRASNGRYVAADYGLSGYLIADRAVASVWERFTFVGQGDGYVALRASNGRYVAADYGLGGRLIANRPVIGEWERFRTIDLGNGNIALQASNGRYVAADYGLGGYLIANRTAIAAWEAFQPTLVECPAGRALCGGACVDLTTSASNCGACGRACASNQVCSAGACRTTCVPSAEVCDGRDNDCDGSVDEGGICSDGGTSIPPYAPDAGRCLDNSQCPAPYVCRTDRACVVGCANAPCPSGMVCASNKTCWQPCSTNAECPAGATCSAAVEACIFN